MLAPSIGHDVCSSGDGGGRDNVGTAVAGIVEIICTSRGWVSQAMVPSRSHGTAGGELIQSSSRLRERNAESDKSICPLRASGGGDSGQVVLYRRYLGAGGMSLSAPPLSRTRG